MLSALPWWVTLYLIVLLVINVGGAVEDYKTSRAFAFGYVLSFCFAVVFVVGFFYPASIESLGFALIPMVAGGLTWEYFSAQRDIQKGMVMLDEEEPFLDETEKQGVIDFAVTMNALLVLPAYLVGIKLCFDRIIGAF